MRGGPLGMLILVVIVAGCADAPRPSGVGFSAGNADTPLLIAPMLEWRTLGVSSMLVLPRATAFDVAIPAGAMTVVVNQTFESGAAYGITISFGECLWDRQQTFVAIGQTIGADCGGLPEGVWSLQISARAGAVSTEVRPVGLFCHETPATWHCPAPAPPLRS